MTANRMLSVSVVRTFDCRHAGFVDSSPPAAPPRSPPPPPYAFTPNSSVVSIRSKNIMIYADYTVRHPSLRGFVVLQIIPPICSISSFGTFKNALLETGLCGLVLFATTIQWQRTCAFSEYTPRDDRHWWVARWWWWWSSATSVRAFSHPN